MLFTLGRFCSRSGISAAYLVSGDCDLYLRFGTVLFLICVACVTCVTMYDLCDCDL